MKYSPHNYQNYATGFILENPVSAVFLDMGLGKSVITLSAIFDLCLDSFEVSKVLVIAPLRVARDTWPDELKKWDHLHGLTYSVAVGTEPERKAALMQRAKVYIINRENVQWLVKESGLPFNYDMVVVDELSSFKSYQAKRFRSLLSVRPTVRRIVGLTGTPSSNGLMDLWAEFRILDMGKRLGRFITHYRNAYFTPDKRNGQVVFSYKPLPGAEGTIYQKISDITISMKAADYLDMPQCVINEVKVRLSDEERNIYDSLKRDLVVSLRGEEIDAGNAAALSGKLCQMANGAVYGEDKRVFPIHDRKLDALEDLIEAAKGRAFSVSSTMGAMSDETFPAPPESLENHSLKTKANKTEHTPQAKYSRICFERLSLIITIRKSSGISMENTSVKKGDVIGKVGHSGNSFGPHLHFQLMDSSDIATANGLPCAFEQYEVFQDGEWQKVVNGIPSDKDRIRFGSCIVDR